MNCRHGHCMHSNNVVFIVLKCAGTYCKHLVPLCSTCKAIRSPLLPFAWRCRSGSCDGCDRSHLILGPSRDRSYVLMKILGDGSPTWWITQSLHYNWIVDVQNNVWTLNFGHVYICHGCWKFDATHDEVHGVQSVVLWYLMRAWVRAIMCHM